MTLIVLGMVLSNSCSKEDVEPDVPQGTKGQRWVTDDYMWAYSYDCECLRAPLQGSDQGKHRAVDKSLCLQYYTNPCD